MRIWLLNMSSMLGFTYIVLGIIYTLALRTGWKSLFRQFLTPTLYNVQSLAIPSLLIIIGLILFFHGWRLDPILQFAFFLQFILLSYVFGKDKVLFKIMTK